LEHNEIVRVIQRPMLKQCVGWVNLAEQLLLIKSFVDGRTALLNLLLPVDNDNPAAGSCQSRRLGEESGEIRSFVRDEREEDDISNAGRQGNVVLFAEDSGDLRRGAETVEDRKHVRRHVDCVDAACGPDERCRCPCKESCASTEIGNSHSCGNAEPAKRVERFEKRVPFRPLQAQRMPMLEFMHSYSSFPGTGLAQDRCSIVPVVFLERIILPAPVLQSGTNA